MRIIHIILQDCIQLYKIGIKMQIILYDIAKFLQIFLNFI